MDIGQQRGAEEGAAPAGKGWRGGGFEPGWGRDGEPGKRAGRAKGEGDRRGAGWSGLCAGGEEAAVRED